MAKELLLSSQTVNAQQISCCFWDYNNGNIMQTYKNGGSVKEKSLNTIGNDYILTAEHSKPLLHLWALNSQETVKDVRCVLPEVANVVEVCPKGTYLAAGMGNKFYIWELSSGALLTVQAVHYQPVSSIKFSSGLECLLVAGEDGMLVAYLFSELINCNAANRRIQRDLEQFEPMYKRMDHPLAISAICIEKFGLKSRFATVSLDATLRLYQLFDGQLLLTLVFSSPLTALVMDCFNVYAGTSKGGIYQCSLTSLPSGLEHHVDEKPWEFIGHSKRIVAMDTNVYNTRLASASEDNCIIVWDLGSRQVLKRLQLKSAPTNVRFMLTHEHFFAPNTTRTKVISSLARSAEVRSENTAMVWMQKEYLNIANKLIAHHQQQENETIELLQAQNIQLQKVNMALINKAK